MDGKDERFEPQKATKKHEKYYLKNYDTINL